MRLGIGITTYNRRGILAGTIRRVRELTRHEPVHLVVADDGSQDGTQEALRKQGIPLVTGPNRGIAWNKNRALFLLSEMLRCDVVILLEDDATPTRFGWESEWIDAAQRWGHVNYAGPWLQPHFVSGAGTPADPVLCSALTAQCAAFSREALAFGGYFDPRFQGYGHEHVEHTRRLARAGYGGCDQQSKDGQDKVLYRLIEGGIATVDSGSHANLEDIERNLQVAHLAMADRRYRAPWSDEIEMQAFRAEQQRAMEATPQQFRVRRPTSPEHSDRHRFARQIGLFLSENRRRA